MIFSDQRQVILHHIIRHVATVEGKHDPQPPLSHLPQNSQHPQTPRRHPRPQKNSQPPHFLLQNPHPSQT